MFFICLCIHINLSCLLKNCSHVFSKFLVYMEKLFYLGLNTNLTLDKHTVVQYHIATGRGRGRVGRDRMEFSLADR